MCVFLSMLLGYLIAGFNQKEMYEAEMESLKVYKAMGETKTHFERALLNEGLVPCKPDTPSDGNCLFHVISLFLWQELQIELTHYEVRTNILNHMKENQDWAKVSYQIQC